MTPREIAMVRAGRAIKLYPNLSPYSTKVAAATAGVRSRILEFTPDVAGFLFVPNLIVPLIKAFYAGPTEVDPSTLFYFGVKKAGKQSPDFADSGFSYHNFSELAGKDQANGINRTQDGTLAVDLGNNLLAYDGDVIVIDADGPDALDPALNGSSETARFEFQARVGRIN